MRDLFADGTHKSAGELQRSTDVLERRIGDGQAKLGCEIRFLGAAFAHGLANVANTHAVTGERRRGNATGKSGKHDRDRSCATLTEIVRQPVGRGIELVRIVQDRFDRWVFPGVLLASVRSASPMASSFFSHSSEPYA